MHILYLYFIMILSFKKISFYLFCFSICIGLSNVKAYSSNSIDTTVYRLRLVEDLDSLDLETGDLAFFQSKTFNGTMTQLGTFSPFTHSAMIIILEDGTIAIVHATDNDYAGLAIPLIEEKGRNGVILTRLDDLFISTNNAKSGYYKRIWIRKLDTNNHDRPDPEQILTFYQNHKSKPFEPSNWQFILSAFDLIINKKDLLQAKENDKIMCSELLTMLFDELSIDIEHKELPCETTPADLFKLSDKFYHEAIEYRFSEGLYRRTSN